MVPEESERTAMVIAVLGSVTPGLSAAIAESFHFVILPSKMLAMTGADSWSGLLRPDRLYETVIGEIRIGVVEHRLALEVRLLLGGDRASPSPRS